MDKILRLASAEKQMNRGNQTSFFDLLSEEEIEKSRAKIELPSIEDWKSKARLKFEKEALGFYISGHPLRPYINEISTHSKIDKSSDLKAEGRTFGYNESVNLAGVISAKIVRLSKKNNEKWAILTVEDLWGTIDVMVFSKTYATATAILDAEEFDDPILITGYAKNDNDTTKIIARQIHSLPDIRAKQSSELQIKLPSDFHQTNLEKLRNLFLHYPGNCAVSLSIVTANSCEVHIQLEEKINACDQFVTDMEEILPLENLFFRYSPKKRSVIKRSTAPW
jgi:DNA polymerase-3 subunit alpha